MRPLSRTLGALIDEMAASRPDAEALVFRGERLSFAALRDRADALARALLALGVRKGDGVAILLPNRPEWLIASVAAAKVGAATVAISTFSTPREIAWTLQHARPSVVVTMEAFCGRAYLAAIHEVVPELARAEPGALRSERLPELRAVVSIDERRHDGVYAWADLLRRAGDVRESALTAAQPAILTHGGALVLQESFEPGEALALLDGERCSVYYGMANMARAILEHPDRPRRTLAGMRTGLTIGLPEDIQMTMEAVNARELCNVYGATETYGNCSVTDAHDPLERRLTTQGLPLPGMEIRVVEPGAERPLPADEVGELRVRGCVTPGYYRDPEQTREAFDADGFFITGDLGTVGEDGRIRFRGRLKEMIKTGGINVAPLEVEGVLLAHPAVKQAYVVGLPDRGKGEVAAAAIELHEGATATAEALTAFCRERLASYKVPARIVFRKAGEFPLTATGKVQKPRLREELEGLCAP